MAVPQAVRGQAWEHREPWRQGQVARRRLSRSLTAAAACHMRDDVTVQSPRPRAPAHRTRAGRGVADQAGDAPADRWLKFLAGHGHRPWRHWPSRVRGLDVHQDRHRWPLPAGGVGAVGGGPEEPFAVVGPAEMAPLRAEEHVATTRAPGFLVADGVAAPGDPCQGPLDDPAPGITWKVCRSSSRLTISSFSLGLNFRSRETETHRSCGRLRFCGRIGFCNGGC